MVAGYRAVEGSGVMTRRIWVEQPHSLSLLTRYGTSVLLTGIASHEGETIVAADLSLRQGNLEIKPSSSCLRTNLLNPTCSIHAYGSFSSNVGRGFALSLSFPYHEMLKKGIAAVAGSVTWTDGMRSQLRLASLDLLPIFPTTLPISIDQRTIGIALASFRPEIELFRRQIESIRRQTYQNWMCAISDDGSGPQFVQEMTQVVGSDQRFVFLANSEHLGFYRNFERAIATIPPSCKWIAFSDQDDEWEEQKLEVLHNELIKSGAPLAFSDMSIFDAGRTKIANTFWIRRKLEISSVSAIALANTVTGMTTIVDSSTLPIALPFPALPGKSYHDAWFALVALAKGRLQYVDQPLVRYVQHGANDTGVFRTPQSGISLILDFWRGALGLLKVALKLSPKRTIPDRLQLFAHWSTSEIVSFSMRAELLGSRLSGISCNQLHRDEIIKFGKAPALIWRALPWRSLRDRYRWMMLVGFMIGSAFKGLISSCLRSAPTRRR